MKSYLAGAVAGAAMVFAVGAVAETQGAFGKECATSLAVGKTYQTDCSVSTVYQGKTYCFGSEQSKALFLKNPDELLAKARAFYASKKQ